MISKWKTLPLDLVNKIMLYQPVESPAMLAWDTATIREVKNNELWCKVNGEIKLKEDEETELLEEMEEMEDIDIEWFHFLITEHYGIGIWEGEQIIDN